MMRILAAIAGGLTGFLVTWLSLRLTQEIHWPGAPAPTSGCFSISDCPHHWWTLPTFFLVLFGPAILYMMVAQVGIAKRWPRRYWIRVFSVMALVTVLVYIAYHAALKYLG